MSYYIALEINMNLLGKINKLIKERYEWYMVYEIIMFCKLRVLYPGTCSKLLIQNKCPNMHLSDLRRGKSTDRIWLRTCQLIANFNDDQ